MSKPSIIEDALILWDQKSNELKELKKLEMDLRIQICEVLLRGKGIGTHNFEFIGANVKAVKKNSMRVITEEFESLRDCLSEDERNCITFKPFLSRSKYVKLEDSSTLDECLMVKPAIPTLSVKIVIDEQ